MPHSLRHGMMTDDMRLIQGATTYPIPLASTANWECEGACLVGFTAMDEGVNVAVVEEAFSKWCFDVDQLLNEPAGCRWLLNWFDGSPRDEVRRLLLPEVNLELRRRLELVPETPPGIAEDYLKEYPDGIGG